MTDPHPPAPDKPDQPRADTASGWLEATADPVARGWQPPRATASDGQDEDPPRRSASAEAAAMKLAEREQQ